MADTGNILIEEDNRCGVISLNRPGALNALSYEMIAALDRQYLKWAQDSHIYAVILRSTVPRAFCSGGDIRTLYEWWRTGRMESILELYGTEYQHNWTLDRFLKPHVSLIDGIVMGGGVGVSLYGTHRVAAENYQFAMPEVGIGFFPDVGATWFLPRLRGRAGLYLALTGRSLGPADAYYLGLATHCIPAEWFNTIRTALSEAEPVDALLDGLHKDPGRSELEERQLVLDRLFSKDSVEEVLSGLEAEIGEHADWARSTAAEIRSKSPLSLKVAFEQYRRGGSMNLEEALQLEYAVARRFMEGEEFFEGIRALIIDKDNAPNWSPANLEDVGAEMVAAYFEPVPDAPLDLSNPFS